MKHLKSNWLILLGLAAAAISAGAIIQAVIPQVVPTANKIGNSTKFQLGIAGAISGDCASFDANLNVTGPGTGAGCAGAAANSGGLTVYSGTAGISLSGTTFFPIGGGSGASTTETAVDADVQASTTISKFGANLSAALGMSNSVVFTWRKNMSSQTLTCTISGAVATSCADSTNSFSVVPGDLVDIQAVFSGTIVVAPTFVLTAQVGSILSGSVNTGTAGQFGYYATNGSAISSAAGMTTHGVVLYEGTSAPASTTAGTSGQCFLSNGASADPAFTTCPAGSSILSGVGVFASRPGSGTNTGDLYKATDSPVSSIWTGAAWSDFAFNVPVTLPQAATTFATAVNVGTSTITNTTGPTILTHTDATNVVGWVTSIFTNTGSFFFNIEPAVHNSFQSGVMFRESATGKLLVFTIAFTTSTTQINVDRWTNPTTFSSNVFRQTYQPLSAPFFALRLRVVGSNLDCDVSWDAGQHWLLVYTETKTAFFTTAPNQDGPATIISGDVETLYNYSTT